MPKITVSENEVWPVYDYTLETAKITGESEISDDEMQILLQAKALNDKAQEILYREWISVHPPKPHRPDPIHPEKIYSDGKGGFLRDVPGKGFVA